MDHFAMRTHSAGRSTDAKVPQRRQRRPCVAGRRLRVQQDLKYQTPDGHNVSLVWEAEVRRPAGLQSLLTRPSKKPLQGIPGEADRPPQSDGFRCHPGEGSPSNVIWDSDHQRVVDGDVEIGAWMSSNLLAHEVACMRDLTGGQGKLHHVAFYYGNLQHNVDAAEMFRDYDIRSKRDPIPTASRKANSSTCSNPAETRSNCSSAGFMHLDPDATTKTWDMADIDTGWPSAAPSSPGDLLHIRDTEPAGTRRSHREVRPLRAGHGPAGALASDRLGGLPPRSRPRAPKAGHPVQVAGLRFQVRKTEGRSPVG